MRRDLSLVMKFLTVYFPTFLSTTDPKCIWWHRGLRNRDRHWWIGSCTSVGREIGFAYLEKDEACPWDRNHHQGAWKAVTSSGDEEWLFKSVTTGNGQQLLLLAIIAIGASISEVTEQAGGQSVVFGGATVSFFLFFFSKSHNRTFKYKPTGKEKYF